MQHWRDSLPTRLHAAAVQTGFSFAAICESAGFQSPQSCLNPMLWNAEIPLNLTVIERRSIVKAVKGGWF